ncbi:MAG TPA: integrase core domain-containing protein, partial [Nitrosomonas sp.]|nr:integrase core domain-containing protein [Nitrosomonas sp.]
INHRSALFQSFLKDCADRRIQLSRFINFYNTVKPHKSLNNATPYEILNAYFNQPLCKQL